MTGRAGFNSSNECYVRPAVHSSVGWSPLHGWPRHISREHEAVSLRPVLRPTVCLSFTFMTPTQRQDVLGIHKLTVLLYKITFRIRHTTLSPVLASSFFIH